MKRFIFLLLGISIINTAISQDFKRCSSTEYEEIIESKYPGYQSAKRKYNEYLGKIVSGKLSQTRAAAIEDEETIYRIPVVVHIIHNTSNGVIGGRKNVNIPDDQIFSQIEVLNQDYRRIPGTAGYNDDPVGADTKIEFCLATRDPDGNATNGIVRVYHAKSTWNLFEFNKLASISNWPSDKYLNIWVTNLPSGTLGFAQFPESDEVDGLEGPYNALTDGVVIDYEYFGTKGYLVTNFNKGRTTTHEVGHWLGLRHIWGDSFCGTDYVSDTPTDAAANEDASCADSSDCNRDGIYTVDMSNNYMDYSFDACMNIFTKGQKIRMRTVMETSPRRRSLLNSPGCCDSKDLTYLPFLEDFESTELNWEISAPGDYVFTKTFPGAEESSNSILAEPKGVFEGDTSTNVNYSYLSSPSLSFAGQSNPVLSFDLAYAAASSDRSTDSLIIACQINCDVWKNLYTIYGEDLITASGETPNLVPDMTDWKNFRYILEPLSYKSVVNLRFEAYSKGKNNLYIDNILVYPTSSEFTVKAYPNPVSDELKLEFIFEGRKDINFSVYSVLGQRVMKETITDQTSFIHHIDVSNLGRGMYIIKADDGKETITKRVLVID